MRREKIGAQRRRARGQRGSIRARSRPRKVPMVFDPRVAEFADRPSRRRHQRRVDRAQDQLPAGTSSGERCSPTASASSTIRCGSADCARARSTAKASPAQRARLIEDGVLTTLGARQRHRARTRPCNDRPCLARRVVGAVAVGDQSLSRSRPADARRADRPTSSDGFYVTDLIGSGVNSVTGDYSRGASGFWIENGKLHLSRSAR